MPRITVGRDSSDVKKFGEITGTGFLGKHILGEQDEASLGNEVRMDIARPHVMGIFGKRGQGKCVTPETEILLGDGSLVAAEQLFNEYSGEQAGGSEDAGETICVPQEPISVVSLGDDLETGTSQVTHLYRKQVDEDLIRITTSQGREITVTKEHPLLTSDGWTESRELEEDMAIALPASLPVEGSLQELSVPAAFEETDHTFRGWRQYDLLTALQDGEQPVSQLSDGTGSFHRLIQSLEHDGLVETRTQLARTAATATGTPGEDTATESAPSTAIDTGQTLVSITAEGEQCLVRHEQGSASNGALYRYGRSRPIRVPNTVDERFARFVSLLLSEGHEQKVDDSNYRILFSNTDQKLLDMFTDAVESLFGITPAYNGQHEVYFNSRALEQFLHENGYKTGAHSREKEIPSFILSSPAPVRQAFLQAFFEAEGSVYDGTIELSTASEDIASTLTYLLLGFGVFANRSVKAKYAANTEDQTRREYHVLKITGKRNLVRFQDRIGFISDRKTQHLDETIPVHGNPNIDTVPHAGPLVQEVREALGMSRGAVKTHKQSLKAYEDGEYAFTQDHLQRVISKLTERLNTLDALQTRLAQDPDVNTIERLIELSSIQWKEINDVLGYSRTDRKFLSYQKFQEGEDLNTLRDLVLDRFDRRHNLDAIQNQLTRLKHLAASDVFWDHIIDVEHVPYQGYVYDITVNHTHNFVAGTGGIISHNSYTMGTVAEELVQADDAVRNNISTVIIDSMGIFWSMKYPNNEDGAVLDEWDLHPESMNMRLLVPEGHAETCREEGIPFDKTFAIRPGEMNAGDWQLAFKIKPTSPRGILMERVIDELKREKGTAFSVKDMIKRTKEHDEFDQDVRRALVNRFTTADEWGIFSPEGITVEELTARATVSILDLSFFESLSRGFSVRALVVGLLARKVLKQRMESKRLEELEEMEGLPQSDSPIVWMLLDEAHQYIPDEGQTPASEPLLQWAKIGREPGVSVVLATQQPARINAKFLSQMDIMVVHRLTAQADIEALGEIMQTYMRYNITEFIDNLPRQNGAAVILDDNSERVYPVQVRPRKSWHAGGTPTAIKGETRT